MLRCSLTLSLILAAGIAQADTGPPLPADWQGMFTTESVGGCVIRKSGSMIRESMFGTGQLGGDVGFGMLENAVGQKSLDLLENNLSYLVGQAGFNGLVGLRIEISHTADAVYEGGTTWKTPDGTKFDQAGSFIAIAYGTPVRLECANE